MHGAATQDVVVVLIFLILTFLFVCFLHYFLDGDNNYNFFGDAGSYGSHFLFLG